MRGVLALLLLVLVVASAGCIREFEKPHYLQVVHVDLAPAKVLARDILLNVTASLDNRGGGETGDVRVEVKTYSEQTGFLLDENETWIGSLPGDTTRAVSLDVRVPREGSVRVDVSVFEDGQGQQRASVYARNLGALEPEVVDTGLRVADIDFLVQEVTGRGGNGSQVTVQADLYLTNEGSAPTENLRIQVKAREITTALVADIQWLETGGIPPDLTVIRSINLTVPDEFNYVFEILTWRGDVIIARNEGHVQLAPTFEKPKDQDVVTTNPDVRNFLQRPTATTSPTYGGSQGDYYYAPTGAPTPRTPGFEAVAVLAAAALAGALFVRRRSS